MKEDLILFPTTSCLQSCRFPALPLPHRGGRVRKGMMSLGFAEQSWCRLRSFQFKVIWASQSLLKNWSYFWSPHTVESCKVFSPSPKCSQEVLPGCPDKLLPCLLVGGRPRCNRYDAVTFAAMYRRVQSRDRKITHVVVTDISCFGRGGAVLNPSIALTGWNSGAQGTRQLHLSFFSFLGRDVVSLSLHHMQAVPIQLSSQFIYCTFFFIAPLRQHLCIIES